MSSLYICVTGRHIYFHFSESHFFIIHISNLFILLLLLARNDGGDDFEVASPFPVCKKTR